MRDLSNSVVILAEKGAKTIEQIRSAGVRGDADTLLDSAMRMHSLASAMFELARTFYEEKSGNEVEV